MRRRARADRPVVAFFGFFGVPNYGNQASLEVAIEIGRRIRPDIEFQCICSDPTKVALAHDMVAISMHDPGFMGNFVPRARLLRLLMLPVVELSRWVGAFAAARRLSAFIVPGTGILDDFGVRPYQMPYTLFRWSIAARLTRTPMILVSVGAGPIRNRASRWLMKETARSAKLRTYRDLGSSSFMADLGAPGSVEPDVVFGRSRPPREMSGSHGEIGVGVMAYYGWENDPEEGAAIFREYAEKIALLSSRILNAGASVRLLIGESTDELAVAEVLTLIGLKDPDHRDRVKVAQIFSFTEFLSEIEGIDAAIVTRYHNLVGSLIMEIPTVSVGYATKNADLMGSMGLGAFCHEVDDFDVELVLRDLEIVRDSWESFRPLVRANLAEYEGRVEELFQEAINFVQA